MKKIFFWKNNNILILLVAIGFTTSCKKLIEIPPTPPNKITQEQQLADSMNIMNAVAGVYVYSASSNLGFGFCDANIALTTGLSSDELSTGTANSTYLEYYNYGLTELNTTVSTLWTNTYRSLYTINTLINELPANKNLSQTFIARITSEMKVMRALYYFNMVNLYGGVPLVLTTDYSQTAVLPRATVNEVYTQIIADLTDAQQNLLIAYPSAGRLRPNLNTALAFLSKVHLYKKDWQNAYYESNTVIQTGTYSLESDLNRVFIDGSNEAIWQLPTVSSNNQTREAAVFVPANATTAPTYFITPFLLNSFVAADQRLSKWVAKSIVTVGGVPTNFFYPNKYKNKLPTSTPAEDYMIFRLGEQYLIRAEAAAQLNNLTQALADINVIRARAGLPASTANVSSQSAVLTAIMDERQRELFTEWGNRWFDLKRTDMANTVLPSIKTNWQVNAALYPIPQKERLLNIYLIQNPGY